MATNDVLPLKAARRVATTNLKCFWSLGIPASSDLISMVSFTFDMRRSVCWPPCAKPGDEVECGIYGEWVKTPVPFHEILGRRDADRLYFQTPFSMSRFVQKIFTTKSRRRRENDQMQSFFWPKLSGRDDPNFYGRLLARFTVRRLAKFGWVLYGDLCVRSLTMK